jgi:colicin import membrane protein
MGNASGWIQFALLFLVFGFSAASWLYGKLREQAELKKMRDAQRRRREQELRTGRMTRAQAEAEAAATAGAAGAGGAATAGAKAGSSRDPEELRRLAERRQAQLRELRERQRQERTESRDATDRDTQLQQRRERAAAERERVRKASDRAEVRQPGAGAAGGATTRSGSGSTTFDVPARPIGSGRQRQTPSRSGGAGRGGRPQPGARVPIRGGTQPGTSGRRGEVMYDPDLDFEGLPGEIGSDGPRRALGTGTPQRGPGSMAGGGAKAMGGGGISAARRGGPSSVGREVHNLLTGRGSRRPSLASLIAVNEVLGQPVGNGDVLSKRAAR